MKILIKAMAGSHLFGTSTSESDMDYKGVFLPTREQILLGNYKESLSQSTGDDQSKNSKDDEDIELYSLKKFCKMIARGDTAALELLFTPEHMIIEKDPLWDDILAIRDQLLSSRVSAMIGYARQQANKYGIKGSRMGDLNNVIKILRKHETECEGPKLKHAWEDILHDLKDFEHVHEITLSSKHEDSPEVPALDILGKRFDYHCNFDYVLQIMTRIYKNFGQRAREAKKNNGIDWKALSHATRVSIQGIELLTTGKITLPLKEKDVKLVKNIKSGSMDYPDVQNILESLLAQLELAKSVSKLQEKVPQEVLDELVIRLHGEVVNENT